MSGNMASNPFGAFGVQGFGNQGLGGQGLGAQGQGLGQQQLNNPQNWADIVSRVTQVAVPVILSALQNNPQLAQSVGGQGQVNPQLNPFAAGPQQHGQLQQQNGIGDIGRLAGGAGQQVVIAVAQHIAQQLPHIVTGLISNLAASQQLRGQSAGLGGQISPQSFAGDVGAWLGGAAQTIGAVAAQQVAQQLPQVIGGVLSGLQNQPQQGQQLGAQNFNPLLYPQQSAQSSYAYH